MSRLLILSLRISASSSAPSSSSSSTSLSRFNRFPFCPSNSASHSIRSFSRSLAVGLDNKMDASPSASASVSTSITSHNQYHSSGLDLSDLSPSPIKQFNSWFQSALSSDEIKEPEAMNISTSCLVRDPSTKHVTHSIPSSRFVLLKKVDDRGFVFYSNYHSRKGRELDENPFISACFYWKESHQSVRIVGRVEKISQQESTDYFQSRPLGSRIGARASPQSQVVKDRKQLEDKVKQQEDQWNVPGSAGLKGEEIKYQDDKEKVPLPDSWGGYRILPFEIEFWVGRENRLHDRFRYTRDVSSTKDANSDQWQIDRLAP